jgi:hypothetical protein
MATEIHAPEERDISAGWVIILQTQLREFL